MLFLSSCSELDSHVFVMLLNPAALEICAGLTFVADLTQHVFQKVFIDSTVHRILSRSFRSAVWALQLFHQCNFSVWIAKCLSDCEIMMSDLKGCSLLRNNYPHTVQGLKHDTARRQQSCCRKPLAPVKKILQTCLCSWARQRDCEEQKMDFDYEWSSGKC